MKLFSWRRHGATVELDEAQRARLARLNAVAPLQDLDCRHGRLVVVDVETSGLHLQRDQLLSIGAIAIEHGAIDFAQGFECTLRRDAPAGASTLLHGLGPDALAEGEAPAEALLAFLEYLGDSPLIAFHADFDRQMLARACREDLGHGFGNAFLDVADLAPALCPDAPAQAKGLDDWIAHFGLDVQQRHHASADALVTAELTLILLSKARQQGLARYAELRETCRQRRRPPGFGF